MEIVDSNDVKSKGKGGRKNKEGHVKVEIKDFIPGHKDDVIGIDEVIGHDNIKELLHEMLIEKFDPRVLDAIKNSNLPVHKGIIIYGFSGVGKTLLCVGVMNDYIRCNPMLAYKIVSGSSLKARSQEGTRDKIMTLLTKIEMENNDKNVSTVLIVNEVDVLFSSRGGHSVINKMAVNTLLEEELGDKGILFIGTTNRIQDIDTAILARMHIRCAQLPDIEERYKLFIQKFQNVRVTEKHMFLKLAEETNGWTGRDIGLLASQVLTKQITKNITMNYGEIKRIMNKYSSTLKNTLKERKTYGEIYKKYENAE